MPGVDIETKDLIVSNSQTGRVSPLVAAAWAAYSEAEHARHK
jgi:hypothetical protein